MARPLRIEYDGAWYHVMNRGAGGRPVFPAVPDGAAFLDLLGQVSERFAIEVHAYCLMDDRYHLLVRTPRGNLGRAMRHLNGVYTQAYNRRHGRDGPLFRGRYKAILVDAEGYLARLGRYLHRQPEETAVVGRAEHYRWSSLRAYFGLAPTPAWLHTQATLDLFGKRRPRRRYRAYVADGGDEELRAFYGRKRLDPVLGDASFRDRIHHRLGRRADEPEISDLRRLRPRPSLERVSRLTASAFGVEGKELLVVRRGRGAGNLPRMVAMALGRSPGGHALKDIARHFGLGHYSSVTAAATRLERRLRDDATLRATVAELRASLAAAPD
ncbi:MAG: transposase [Kiloniellales bacterium]